PHTMPINDVNSPHYLYRTSTLIMSSLTVAAFAMIYSCPAGSVYEHDRLSRRVPAQKSSAFVPAHDCCVRIPCIPARAGYDTHRVRAPATAWVSKTFRCLHHEYRGPR